MVLIKQGDSSHMSPSVRGQFAIARDAPESSYLHVSWGPIAQASPTISA